MDVPIKLCSLRCAEENRPPRVLRHRAAPDPAGLERALRCLRWEASSAWTSGCRWSSLPRWWSLSAHWPPATATWSGHLGQNTRCPEPLAPEAVVAFKGCILRGLHSCSFGGSNHNLRFGVITLWLISLQLLLYIYIYNMSMYIMYILYNIYVVFGEFSVS